MIRPLLRIALALSPAIAVAPMIAHASPSATASGTLRGTLSLTGGSYRGGHASGTYFRMIFPGRGRRYFKNPDSSAADKTYTLLAPGRSGGVVPGRFQQHPHPAFDRSGNSLAGLIVRPQRFAGLRFGVSTLPTDPQSHRRVPAPSFRVSGRRITGQVEALTADWNRQYFNQGAPKPGGSRPMVTGAYNPRTHHFAIAWTSTIRGGPFNGFTGYWHLQGVVR